MSPGKSFTEFLGIISLPIKITLPIKVQQGGTTSYGLLCVALNNSDIFFLMSESKSMGVFDRRIY